MTCIFYIFLFRLKLVEICMDPTANSAEQINQRYQSVKKKMNCAIAVFILACITFSLSQTVFVYYEIGDEDDNDYYEKMVTIVNLAIYVPYRLGQIYLLRYFWRLGTFLIGIIHYNSPKLATRSRFIMYLTLGYMVI